MVKKRRTATESSPCDLNKHVISRLKEAYHGWSIHPLLIKLAQTLVAELGSWVLLNAEVDIKRMNSAVFQLNLVICVL